MAKSENNDSTLDLEFAKWLESYVEQMLHIHRMARPASRTQSVWGCKNLGDFMCGFFVGEMIGAAIATFQARYKREPTAEEHAGMAHTVEAHAEKIRDVFLTYN